MTIVVNGTNLDEDAIGREIQYHPAEDLNTAKAAAEHALVVRTLLLQQARSEGFSQEDDDAIEALLEEHIAVDEPAKDRCQELFEKGRQRYRAPDLFEASHILISAQPGDTEQQAQAQAKAEEYIAVLQKKPGNFSKLAAEFSACPSSKSGGSLGQFSNGETVEEFETFLYNLEPGQLCPVPVNTKYGCHVLRLDHREIGRELPFESAFDSIRDDLLSMDWRKAASNYVKILVENADISGIKMT